MINVAIDGPAGAGKSTVAKAAAKELGYIYVDTGALYRTVALNAVRNSIIDDSEKIVDMLSSTQVELKYVDGVLKNWHKKGIKTPNDVIVDNEKHTNSNKKDSKKSNRLSSTPNFDIDEIAKKAMFDDNFDI